MVGYFTLNQVPTSAWINYNGQVQPVSVTTIENNYTLTSTNTTAPLVDLNTLVPFHFAFSVGTTINTTIYQQTVLNVNLTFINGTSCTNDTFTVINLYNYDEKSRLDLSATVEFTMSLYDNNENIITKIYGVQTDNKMTFCSNINLSNAYSKY
jgi:hypothetical protein